MLEEDHICTQEFFTAPLSEEDPSWASKIVLSVWLSGEG